MELLTRVISKIYTIVFTLLVVCVSVSAQGQGKLTVQGAIVCNKKAKEVVSSVTIYRYYHQSHSVELIEQQMVARDGNFKFNVEFDMDYIIDVASNTGVHKRVNLNTEVMNGYKYANQKIQFAVDVDGGDEEDTQDVAWIYFDPSKNDFAHSDQMPVAWNNR